MPADLMRTPMPRSMIIVLALALGACASPPKASPPPPVPVEPRSNAAERQLQQAIQAAHPRTGNPARARTLLEALLAAGDDASRALHPYARALLDQLTERQRLDAANLRLTQQLERTGQQLKDSQQRGEDLQRKVDALADIERTLPARAPTRAVPR